MSQILRDVRILRHLPCAFREFAAAFRVPRLQGPRSQKHQSMTLRVRLRAVDASICAFPAPQHAGARSQLPLVARNSHLQFRQYASCRRYPTTLLSRDRPYADLSSGTLSQLSRRSSVSDPAYWSDFHFLSMSLLDKIAEMKRICGITDESVSDSERQDDPAADIHFRRVDEAADEPLEQSESTHG